MTRLTFLLVPLLASLVAQATQLALQAPSYEVLSSDGNQLRSEQYASCATSSAAHTRLFST